MSIGTPVRAHHTPSGPEKTTSATYYVPSFFALLPGLIWENIDNVALDANNGHGHLKQNSIT